MPNDEYFEAQRPDWGTISAEESLAWTLVFLDYPPRFLGVIGMLATQDGYRHGKPARNRVWNATALQLSAIGINPYLYALVRSKVSRTLETSDWRRVHRDIDRGKRVSTICQEIEADIDSSST
jgi:hypothetical protein